MVTLRCAQLRADTGFGDGRFNVPLLLDDPTLAPLLARLFVGLDMLLNDPVEPDDDKVLTALFPRGNDDPALVDEVVNKDVPK